MRNALKKLFSYFDSTDVSGIKNMILKPVSMILSLVYTPILLNYLGDEKYGLWATVLSIISWVNYFDVGIGHGLRNMLTKHLAKEEYEDAKKAVSTAYILLTAIAGGILLILIGLVVFLNWHSVFNTNLDMRPTLAISFVFITVNFILALSNTLLYAVQLAERVALRNCLVQLLNVIGLVFLINTTQSSLVAMSILFGCTSFIVYCYNSFSLFRKYKYLRPSIHLFSKEKLAYIGNVGLKFFAIQISCMLLYTVDNLIITHYFGSIEVTPFNVVYKAFNMVFSFLSALTVPYWSRTTKALQLGDINWVKRAISKVRKIYCCFVFAYILLAILFKPLAKIWMGKELSYQPGIISVMCVYYILFSFVTITTPFINGSGEINGQLVLSVFMGIANVPFSIFLSVNLGLGVLGVRLATTILMAIGVIYYPVNLNQILKKYKCQT